MNTRTLRRIHKIYIITIWGLLCLSLVIVYLVNTNAFSPKEEKMFRVNAIPNASIAQPYPMSNRVNF